MKIITILIVILLMTGCMATTGGVYYSVPPASHVPTFDIQYYYYPVYTYPFNVPYH